MSILYATAEIAIAFIKMLPKKKAIERMVRWEDVLKFFDDQRTNV
ncbi:hypothetical protein OsccyDRAFT_3159 [Leptolyngbyaceae cyanobacterium JSC-12]|nr:hypothetical protein OsccyDRAFT_3159 [Leptolyngbyaceae cyanobacterium JSC-12]